MDMLALSVLAGGRTPRGPGAFKPLLKRGVRKLEDLIAMSKRRDPFCAGTDGQTEQAQWFHGIWAQYVTSALAHLRRIHYLLISQPDPRKADGTPYLNTEACWEYLQQASAYARYLGLVDPRRLEDHRNPEPHLPPTWLDERTGPAVGWDTDFLVWLLPTISTDLADELHLAFPEPWLTGYDYTLAAQRYHLEVWIEKSTMNDVLLPVVRRYGAVLVTSVGFQSVTSAVQLITQRVKRDGKPTRLFYISDFDPAGDRMPVALARQIEFWLEEYAPGADIKLQTLALTREQVQQYHLPRVPIRDTDRRKGQFEDRHGEGAVELDALEALYPGTLAGIVEAALAPYLDRTLAARYAETGEDAEADASERWQEQTADLQDELGEIRAAVETIYAQRQDELERLHAALEQDLAPYRTQLRALAQRTREAMAAFAPALPELPEANEADEADRPFLYDSARTYWEQLACYKQHTHGMAAGEEAQDDA